MEGLTSQDPWPEGLWIALDWSPQGLGALSRGTDSDVYQESQGILEFWGNFEIV